MIRPDTWVTGPWAYGAPVGMEQVESFLERLAAANTTSIQDVMLSLGFELSYSDPFPPYFGVRLRPQDRAILDRLLGEDAVTAMTLAAFDGGILDLSRLDLDDRYTINLARCDAWIHVAGSRYCPECLAVSAAWPLFWKLPWAFACVEHECLLIDVCPGCHRRPRTVTSKGTTRLRQVEEVPLLGHCNGPGPEGDTATGRGSLGCLTDLTAVERVPADEETIRSQLAVLAITSDGGARWCGRDLDEADAFRTLQCLAVIALRSRRPDDGEAEKLQLWRVPPRDARAIADAVSSALHSLTADTVPAGALRLAPVLDSAEAITGERGQGMATLTRQTPLAKELAAHAGTLYGRPTTRMRRYSKVHPRPHLDAAALTSRLQPGDLEPFRPILPMDARTTTLRDAVRIGLGVSLGHTVSAAAEATTASPAAASQHARYIHNRLDDTAIAAWTAAIWRLMSDLEHRPLPTPAEAER